MSLIYEYLPDDLLQVMQAECFGISAGTWITAVIVVILIWIALKVAKKALKVGLFVAAVVFVATHVIGTYI